MIDKTGFELMARYNQWMNEKIYAVCADIPDAARRKDLGAFFKSIHGTLNHLMYGDKAWMNRFTGQSIENLSMDKELYSDFDKLRKERERMDRDIIEWSRRLQPDWLAADFEFTSKVDNKPRTMPAWALVMHMFNHQTHHRGQVTTLIKQLGHEPGVTDIPFMPQFQAGKQ
jgi:uncharacterized damage-inducible protein DinB